MSVVRTTLTRLTRHGRRSVSESAEGPAEPGQSAAHTGANPTATGIIGGSFVSGQRGWCRIESIRPGDRVLTFDHGLQPVKAHEIRSLDTRMALADYDVVIYVPKHAIGNRRSLHLMPMQEVVVESDHAERAFGDPFVIVPAKLLEGYKNITLRKPQADMRIHLLQFDSEELVPMNGGTLVIAQGKPGAGLRGALRAAEHGYARLSSIQLGDVLGTLPRAVPLSTSISGAAHAATLERIS